jgi:hypothetical protein
MDRAQHGPHLGTNGVAGLDGERQRRSRVGARFRGLRSTRDGNGEDEGAETCIRSHL